MTKLTIIASALVICIILSFAAANNAAEIKDKRVLEHMVLHYVNPCSELFRVDFTVDYDYSFALDYYKRLVMSECYKQYKKNWLVAVDKIKKCADDAPRPKRPKRQVLNTLGNIVGNAVTNFITSQFQANSITNRDQRLKEFYQGFDMNEFYKDNANTYLEVCSESSKHHLEEIKEQALSLPSLICSTAKVHGEILANTANLNTIAHYCRRGKVATEELGELMGNSEFSLVDPDKTEIISVETGPNDDSISFKYYVNYDNENNTNWILYLCYALGILSFLICLTLYEIYTSYKNWKLARQNTIGLSGSVEQ